MKINFPVYLILLIVLSIFIYNHFIFDTPAGAAPILDSLDDLQKQTMSTLNDMTTLLISLSTALFGLIGYFAIENYKLVGSIEEKYHMDIVIAFSCAALSIDFGYIFMEKWVELLSIGVFRPFDTLISLPRKLQITSFLISLFFSGRLVFKNLFNEKNRM